MYQNASSGVKITKSPWAKGPYLEGWAPRSTGLGAQQAPGNFRGWNIEIVKDISTAGPAGSDEGPTFFKARGLTGPYNDEPYFRPCHSVNT